MHIHTHLKAASQGQTGLGVEADGMVEHDGHIGQLLKKLDDLGIANNTIVIYTSDNGAEVFSWPDGGTTPYRSEKNSNWEGGYRVPMVVRWPGVIKPGTENNEVISHEDWLPTLMAAAGQPKVKESLLTGLSAGGTTYRVHLDGYDLLPALKGETKDWPRREFLYWTDDGDAAALRYEQWKMSFLDQRSVGLAVWQDPLVVLRFPKLFNLRTDPFERADKEAAAYPEWRIDHAFLVGPAIGYVAQWIQSFKDFPPRQKPGSFNLSEVMEKLSKPPQ
jgi:arylsulfatase